MQRTRKSGLNAFSGRLIRLQSLVLSLTMNHIRDLPINHILYHAEDFLAGLILHGVRPRHFALIQCCLVLTTDCCLLWLGEADKAAAGGCLFCVGARRKAIHSDALWNFDQI